MNHHNTLTNLEFEQMFESCALNPSLFTHEAHLRLAWIYINKYGVTKSVNSISCQLKNYVKHVGASDKYHETVTIVGVQIVHHYLQKSAARNFVEFINEFPQLNSNFIGLVNSHYSFDILKSDIARKQYVEPDLKSFT